jgi:hypothetical protein
LPAKRRHNVHGRGASHDLGVVVDHEGPPPHCSEARATKKLPSSPIWMLLVQNDRAYSEGREGWLRKEATVNPKGAVFQPELIELMKSVLDDATIMLPEAKRTSAMKAQIASHILACAAKGERDPVTLRTAALLAVVECSNYSHDMSPARRAV